MTHALPTAPWRLRLLGGFAIDDGQQRLTRLHSRAAVLLLARLALRPGRDHGREELAALLWPEADGVTGLARLRQTLSTLRATLERRGGLAPVRPLLAADRRVLRLVPGALACDVWPFEQACAAGDAAAAQRLYAGELLPGFADEWVVEERLRLQALADRFGVATPATTVPTAALLHDPPALGDRAPPPMPVADPSLALPLPAGRWHGDPEALAALAARAGAERVLTLRGPGGIGKTRLALELLQRLAGAGEPFDVLRFVSCVQVQALPALQDALLLALRPPSAAGDALARFAQALAGRRALLVLDNAEGLEPAALQWLLQALQRLPGLHLLLTSRRVLGLPGEADHPVPALALPAPGTPWADLARNPAVRLFVERAAASRADFQLHAGNAEAVAALVQRLQGLPLALELAAARVRLLGIAGVQARLDRQLELLSRGAPPPPGAPPRQQTLRGALQWSHGLLDAPARTVFRRLAVFAGSFAPAAAQQVCADDALDEWAMLDQLRLLADRSLLQRVPAAAATGEARWRLLVAAQQFAAERLDEAGETTATRRRHAEAMLAVFDAADEAAADAPVLPWVDALLPDLDNLRAALEWVLGAEGDLALAVALAGAAGSFWHAAGLDDDAGRVLRRLQPLVEGAAGQELPPRRRALFWWALALRGADARFSWQETFDAADRALAIAREIGDARLLHRVAGLWLPLAQRLHRPIDHDAVLAELRGCEGADWSSGQRRARRLVEGRLAHLRGDLAGFIDSQRAELALARAEGDDRRAWLTAHNVAIAELGRGRVAEAVALMRPVADEIRARGLARRCWQQMAALALALIEAGEAAAPEIPEAVALMQVAGALTWMPCHLAEWMAQRGRLDDAARLLGWTDRRYAERGESASAQGEAARRRLQAVLDGALAPAQQQALHDEGALLSDEAAARLLRGAAAA